MHDERDAEDARLLAAGQYATLFATYLPVIRARVCVRVRGAGAEDVAAKVLLRLWKELKAGKQYSVPFRVVVFKVTDWMIKEHFRSEGKATVPLPEDYDPVLGVEDEYDDPDEIEAYLAQLTQHEREVFELRALHGLSAKETAAELGMDPNAVDQTYHRAKTRLRKLFRQ